MQETKNGQARERISRLRGEFDVFKESVDENIREIKTDVKNHLSEVTKKIDKLTYSVIALLAGIITTFIAVILK